MLLLCIIICYYRVVKNMISCTVFNATIVEMSSVITVVKKDIRLVPAHIPK